VVPDLPLFSLPPGGLTLALDNGYCSTVTDMLNVTELPACAPCEDVNVKPARFTAVDDGTGFIYYEVVAGGIQNPYSFPVTVTLSSPEGTFSPASLTLPPVSSIDFANDPIDFIPFNPIVNGITVEYDVTGNPGGGNIILCQDFISIEQGAFSKLPGNGKSKGFIKMTVVPNPTQAAAQVQYVVDELPGFKGGTIKLYSLSGSLVQAQKVRGTKGQTRFDLNGLASGTYVVVFFNQGQRLGQQIIIKE
jgi:hypothetical protein